MCHKKNRVKIGFAGNTFNPALHVIEKKGFLLGLYESESDQNSYLIWARKDNCEFVSSNPVELLGLISMWENRGDEWKEKEGEKDILEDLLDEYFS
jgi:hypothetical protein